MQLNQVAVQLYTLRDFLKTPAEIATTLRRVKELGYSAVQASGLGPIAEDELNKILEANGLVCFSTHESGTEILDTPAVVAERLHKLGSKYVAYPYPGGVNLSTQEDIEAFAAALNKAGQALAEAGIVLLYHNHAIEFRRFGDKTMLEIIYENTDPRYVQGEIDTYWVQYGGGDPVEWCKRLDQRLPLLHIKDYAIDAEYRPVFAEIGSGNLDFKRIIPAAEASGCEWFIVEQDRCPGDPFDSLAQSLEYIKTHLLS